MSTSSKNKTPVILLFGPTASGKTDLAAQFFQDHFEVINADSQQVYRGLDIGTAKPAPALRARLPHHLIDLLPPSGQFTVGDFVREADRLAAEIAGRGRVPLVMGGTAYYLKHFAYGLPSSPPSDPEVRGAVQEELRRKGNEALHAELRRLDPDAAGKISSADTYRLSRALEVIRQSGRPLSSFRAAAAPRAAYAMLFIGLTLAREELKERIGRRVERMFTAGLPDEFHRLVASGYDERAPGMKGIGYREFFQMQESDLSLAEVMELIKLHSLQYAKRQMTFFKSFTGTTWFRPEEGAAIRAHVMSFLKEQAPDLLAAGSP